MWERSTDSTQGSSWPRLFVQGFVADAGNPPKLQASPVWQVFVPDAGHRASTHWAAVDSGEVHEHLAHSGLPDGHLIRFRMGT